jgi:hypothetical protein
VVYGKASREENHEHNDDGQVCIDGFGERLIVDLGSPSGYPADFFEQERWNYYNASIRGHNIVQVGDRELQTAFRDRGDSPDTIGRRIHGRFIDYAFEDDKGGYWRVELTPAYEGVESVRRTVVHALPGVIVVIDDVKLADVEELSLRWHTVDKASPASDGSFSVKGDKAACHARVIGPRGVTTRFRRAEHQYEAPFDRDRLGALLEERHESYVQATCVAKEARFISLFAVESVEFGSPLWQERASDTWAFETSTGAVSVNVGDDQVSVARGESVVWEVGLP